MRKNNLTYRNSGVNINAADNFVKYISYQLKKTKKGGNFKNIGGFGSVSRIPRQIKEPYLVTSTDGVGTKLEIANDLKKFDTIGIDLVAMSVNDLIVQGAQPIIFLDYISIGKLNIKKLKSIVRGIIKGCKISKCELAGGETAEMPGTYLGNKFDLAGFAVGLVEKSKILRKNLVKKNDLIFAIPSSGLHSNGYSLVRKIIKIEKINIKKNNFLKKELIRPTKIYVDEIMNLNQRGLIKGCANITGGGLEDNLKRVIPDGLSAKIDINKIKPKKIFNWIKNKNISDNEMIKTFNCGVGFCIIVSKKNIFKIKKFFSKNYQPYLIGEIENGKKKIILNGKINWGYKK
ncbi:MAG: phosphoribosylformylglycinamidine cyclo-ligase [Rickettsiales bacterium TMED289]|nr:MAG: phosphoribosylformylglycinamidine cyclo-ligase [Rickettsiales bacterium TMED289]|tara:strand:+ start:10054 stop:11091 length:1038 start_codon:yes stop_codon:yes gene_type:complete